DRPFRSATANFVWPCVIRLRAYVRVPRAAQRKISRRALFARDAWTCVYCGATDVRLTLDHVVPRSRGGDSVWENVVTSCAPCNLRKGNRLLDEISMALRKPPRPPAPALFIRLAAPTTRSKTAVQALAADSAEMRRLIDALKAAGIPASSLQTSSVSLSPNTSDGGDTIVGYSASNTVSVTIANLGRAGKIVDAAVAAGANQVDGPNLTVSDQGALYRAALKAAIADARVKAEAIAEASGLRVGTVSSVEETGDTPTPVRYAADSSAPSA